jgi:hypothetical protein
MHNINTQSCQQLEKDHYITEVQSMMNIIGLEQVLSVYQWVHHFSQLIGAQFELIQYIIL